MGKKRGGGSCINGGGSYQLLRRRIEAARKKCSTIKQLVDHLRSSYPDYARHKLRPFTKQVERVIMVSSRRNDDGDTPTVIKRRKIDNKEEKPALMEYDHLRCRNVDVTNNVSGSGCSSSSLASASYSVDGSDEEGFDNKGMKDLTLMNEKSKLRDKKVIPLRGLRSVSNTTDLNYSNLNNGPMFKDFGGISGVIEELKMDVIVPLLHPQLLCHLGVKPMSGILFHGPPGCGKTKLAHAIANETGVSFYKMCATELVSGVSGASEENIRKVFSEAYRTSPSIVFIDEIDAIASKRDNLHREMEKRIVTQLLTSMDESHVPVKPAVDDAGPGNSDCRPGYVLVIAATNRPNAVDPALRRPGRFDREIALGLPDEAARIEILSALIQSLRVDGALDIQKIARSTPGFSGADLTALAQEAGKLVIKRNVHARKVELSKAAAEEEEDWEHSEEWLRRPWSVEEVGNLSITMADFEEAAKTVQPSSGREGFSEIPDVKWDNVGGLHLLRQEFHSNIIRRIKFPEVYENFGVDLAIGFLLYGPPGCGKTLIAKAVANEAGTSFIHIKGPELLDKYLGESELQVRNIFCRARTRSPCIIFFDEVDALTRKRGEEGGCVERVLNQLLIELDGSEHRRGVYVIGATNRLEVMDDALLRPGRFGKVMYVPLPTPDERGMILKALARKKPIDTNVDLIALGKDRRCDNLSGADLSALVNGAAMAALEDFFSSTDSLACTIKDAHFTMALEKISPSVTDEQRHHYEHFWESFRTGMRA